MGIIDHHQGAVPLGQSADLAQAGYRSVHGEHAVGGDQAHPGVLRVLQRRFELVHVVVGVAQPPRLAQADAVDDARMIQRIADDRILLVEQGFEQSAVRIEAGRVQDRVLHGQIPAEPLLQFAVHALRPADEAHRGGAVAVTVESVMGGLDHGRMVREPEVVVGAQIDHAAPVGELHHRPLRARDDPFALQQAGGFERRSLPREAPAKFVDAAHAGIIAAAAHHRGGSRS